MRILIIDDHVLFAEGLRHLLQAAGDTDEIVCCHSEQDALELAGASGFDLVLLDWHLGRERGGANALAAMRDLLPGARLVVVSGEDDPSIIRTAIDLGAVGFVPKNSTPALMIDALTITAHGGIYLPAQALVNVQPGDAISAKANGLGAKSASRGIGTAFPQLTPRQADVLRETVRGLSNKQIARALDISEGTVKQHLVAVFRELDVQSRTEAVYLLAKQGIYFD